MLLFCLYVSFGTTLMLRKADTKLHKYLIRTLLKDIETRQVTT